MVGHWQPALAIGLIALSSGCRNSFDGNRPDASMGFLPDTGTIDAPPDPILSVENGDTGYVIEAPGRFAIEFVEIRAWQPQVWRDATRGDLDLSGGGVDVERGSLVTPLIFCSGGCVSASTAENPAMTVEAQDERSVTLRHTWDWTLSGGQAFAGVATYVIDVDGTWSTTSSLTNNDAAPVSGSLEIADAHVNEGLQWRVTESLEGRYYDFHLPAGTLPEVRFSVTLDTQLPTSIQADEFNNRYFVTNVTLEPSETREVEWTAQLWN